MHKRMHTLHPEPETDDSTMAEIPVAHRCHKDD